MNLISGNSHANQVLDKLFHQKNLHNKNKTKKIVVIKKLKYINNRKRKIKFS